MTTAAASEEHPDRTPPPPGSALGSAPPVAPVAERLRRLVLAGAVALLLWPLAELALQAWIRAHVVPAEDWRAAAAFVRREWREHDLVTAAPLWADPNMREAVGDLLTPSAAGRSDTAAFARLWVMSIRGHVSPEAPERAPDVVREFGGVTVSRFVLPRPSVRADLVDRLREARVEWLHEGRPRPCVARHLGLAAGGGVDDGPITPADRFVCDPGRPWLWVGETIIEDLELLPRRCVWQHPEGREPIRTTFTGVELSRAVVLYGGLHYDQARDLDGGPVHVRLLVDGAPAGRATVHDADGWKRLVVDTGRWSGTRHDLSVEVTAPDPRNRVFCWAATVRDALPRGAAR